MLLTVLVISSTGEDRTLLDMSRMCGYARKRQSQKGLHRDLSDFQTIAVSRFRIRNKLVNRGMHSLLSVKAEDGRLDVPSEEEEGPARLVDVPSQNRDRRFVTVVQPLE